MTLEQKKHEDEYYAAKRRYESAYSDAVRYQNEIQRLYEQRTKLINEINRNNSEKKRFILSSDDLKKAISNDGGINDSLKSYSSNLMDATNHFKMIGESDLGMPKSISEAFSDADKAVENNISTAFSKINSFHKDILHRIDEFGNTISRLENELQENKNLESRYLGYINDANRRKNNASVDMAYHKRLMQEV